MGSCSLTVARLKTTPNARVVFSFVDPDFKGGYTVCLYMLPVKDGTAATKADLLHRISLERMCYEFSDVANVLQNCAAVGVASELGYAAESCIMHIAAKISQAAVGDL